MPQQQHSPIASRLLLGVMLGKLRREAGLTGVEVAKEMGFGQGKLSKIEGGQSQVSKADLHLFFAVLGVEDNVQATLTELRQQAQRPPKKRSTTTDESALPGKKFEKYLGLEEIAVGLKSWQTHLIPGLLQTPDHARALISANPRLADEQIDHLVQLRLDRQQVLKREPDPLQVWAIVEEHALRRIVGGTRTHLDQLKHLLDLQEQHEVTVQVMPASMGAHPGLDGAFALLDVGHAMPPVVYIDSRGMNTYLEGVGELAAYQAAYDQIQSAALAQQKSARLISDIMRDIT